MHVISKVLLLFSDETADDLNNAKANHNPSGWRLNRQSSAGNRSRGDSQEITYVPTSVLKGHHQGMELQQNPNGPQVLDHFSIDFFSLDMFKSNAFFGEIA